MVFYGDKARGDYGEERSSYKPLQEHYDIAQEYGVLISPSTNKLKKLNVYKPAIAGDEMGSDDSTSLRYKKSIEKRQRRGNYEGMLKIAEIGGMYQDGEPYGDYFTYLDDPTDRYGNEVNAEQARQRYLVRHQHENKINKKFFDTLNDEGEMKRDAIDLGSPSFWADVILWGKKANEQKITMKKDFQALDQLAATHAITDDFEFDLSFAKIVDKRIQKIKNFIKFSKKFEDKNEKLLQDYISKNEDELLTFARFTQREIDDVWGRTQFKQKDWSSKFYTAKEFKNKNINKIKELYYEAIENTAVFERQLLFNQKILEDYNKRLKDSKLKQLGQNTATNKEIAKLAEEANKEAIANMGLTDELNQKIEDRFEKLIEPLDTKMEPAEYGNEGGKIFAKTIQLKDGSEINVLLDENKKFTLSSLVIDKDGNFSGTLVDFYDQMKGQKFTFKGVDSSQTGKILPPKAEYKKVFKDVRELAKRVDKTEDAIYKKYDASIYPATSEEFDAVNHAMNMDDKQFKTKYPTTKDLLPIFKKIEDYMEEVGEHLEDELDDDDFEKALKEFHDKVYKGEMPNKLKGKEMVRATDIDRLYKSTKEELKEEAEMTDTKKKQKQLDKAKRKRKVEEERQNKLRDEKIKRDERKALDRKYQKDFKKLPKMIYQLYKLAYETTTPLTELRDDLDMDFDDWKKAILPYKTRGNKIDKINDFALMDWSFGRKTDIKFPTTMGKWQTYLKQIDAAHQENVLILNGIYKKLKKKLPKGKVADTLKKFNKLNAEIVDILNEYRDYKAKPIDLVDDGIDDNLLSESDSDSD